MGDRNRVGTGMSYRLAKSIPWNRFLGSLKIKKTDDFKTFKEPRIDTKEPIPPGCVAWRAGTTNPIPTRFLALIDCFKIQAQAFHLSTQTSLSRKVSFRKCCVLSLVVSYGTFVTTECQAFFPFVRIGSPNPSPASCSFPFWVQDTLAFGGTHFRNSDEGTDTLVLYAKNNPPTELVISFPLIAYSIQERPKA
jgi:hypothetical protein